MAKKFLLLITMISLLTVLGCTSFYEAGTLQTGLENDTNGAGGLHISIPNQTQPNPNETSNQSYYNASEYIGCFDIGNFQYDAQGDDNVNLNDEYITTQNLCNESINMTGWRITDAGRNVYEFPEFVLPAFSVFILHSGCGTDSSWHLYWCSDAEIWDNTGDTLYMSNSYGALQYNYSY